MLEKLLRKQFVELRARGLTIEEISQKLETGIEILQEIERESQAAIAIKKEKHQKDQVDIECSLSLEKDLKKCDQLLDLILKEIQCRNLANLTLSELVRFETDLLKIKDKKVQFLAKQKQIINGGI